MADYLSDLKGFGKDLLPDGDALKRKIDSQRENFLRGISTTRHGKKEDPTYLHFRFIFDFGETAMIDPETFLAPSPLFRDTEERDTGADQELLNLAGSVPGGSAKLPDGVFLTAGGDAYLKRLHEIDSLRGGRFFTDTDFFYGSKFLIKSRFEQGAFAMSEGTAYMGAQQFLAQRSAKRQQMISAFKKGLRYINEKCPYYFQSISGLDQLLKVDIKNLHKEAGKPQRMGTLTIDCLESMDMRLFSLSELYRKAIYDYTYHRVMLPENLRKFRMWLVVSEIRNIQLSYGINDILNPFSIPSVAQGANFLDSFNSQTGLLNNTEGLLQKSTKPGSVTDKFGSYTLGPYAFIYQFDQCEFDFDETYPSYATIDNKGGQAVNTKFKIHVGRVKDYKIQFNLLSDVIKKEDNIKSMVLADTWGSVTDSYDNYDYAGSTGISGVDFSDKPNPADYFKQMASNFITNSVADLKEQGFNIGDVNISTTSLQGALLGNIYGLGGFDPRSQLRSYYNLDNLNSAASPLKIPNPFRDNSPQARGLGGPSERAYPDINQDVYGNVPGPAQQNLGSAYNGGASAPGGLNEDIYPNNPGSSLGLPDRQYPQPGGDEYKNVPGSDLGVPGRTYPLLRGDVYPDNPGKDLGLPDRQYPEPGGDEYLTNPGISLGVPERIYPEPTGDVYLTNPGADLGLPDREYPQSSSDEYPNSTQVETSNIGEVYPENNNEYGSLTAKEYEDTETNKKNEPIGDVYDEITNKYSQIKENVYPQEIQNPDDTLGEVYTKNKIEYGQINDDEYKDSGSFKRTLSDDVYKTVPGRDLGAPGRNYDSLNSDEYPKENVRVNTSRIGRIYPSNNNENN